MKKKNLTSLCAPVAIAAALVAGLAHGDEQEAAATAPADPAESSATVGGLAGNLYFTDEQGNPRNPSAEELIAAGKDFQRDLARIAGKNSGKTLETKHANGATSAVVALSKLSFLVAETDEEGNLVLRHGALDENGNVVTPADAELPEM